MKSVLLLLSAVLLIPGSAHSVPAPIGRAKLAFVIMVASHSQERDAALLIDSIHAFAGDAAKAPIYVLLADPANAPGRLLSTKGVRMIEVNLDPRFRNYPFADKVWGSAQIEELAEKETDVLVWLNPESLILAPPVEFNLPPSIGAAVRPVHVQNVGLTFGTKPDAFWDGVYKAAGITPERAFEVESFTGSKVHAYFNSGGYAVRPQRGILRTWKTTFEKMLLDRGFQAKACPDQLHQIYLHQAVLSAVLAARLGPKHIRLLARSYSYPVHLQDSVPPGLRISNLNGVVHAIGATSLRDLQWMEKVPVEEPLKGWILEHTRNEPVQVGPGILRAEGSCNSYLVETPDGNVLIDPGSAGGASSPLANFNGKPVKAVLLTHGHSDHIAQISTWVDKGVPIVAQREYAEFQHYELRLAGFFDPRATILSGSPAPKRAAVIGNRDAKIAPNTFFTDNYSLEIGGAHFEMFHFGGETPDQSLIWVPERKALFIGDDYYVSFPNFGSPRGSKPRWPLDWVAAVDKALDLRPEILFPGHRSPIYGADEIAKRLTRYRDAILYVHDATVKGMNERKDVHTLMREIKLPPELAVGEFYGNVPWSVRGIYESYAGWFDGNLAHLYDEPVESVYPELVKLAGGTEAISRRAQELAESGDDVRALHLSDVVLNSDPGNTQALKARFTALKSLRSHSQNFIENAWLDYGIRETEAALARVQAAEQSSEER